MISYRDRDSNFELLKIISMFFVVTLHICTQSGIADKPCSALDEAAFMVFSEFGRTACTVFVMASAWFLSGSSFKIDRLFKVWFKTAGYVLIFYFLIYHSYDMPWYDFFPIGGGILWFISAYMAMLLVSPLLNAALSHCPQKYLGITILLIGIPMLVYPTIALTDGMLGDNVLWFSWLYLLMGYLRKYPVKIFSNISVMTAAFFVLCFIRLFPRIEVRWSGRIPAVDSMIPYLNWWRDVLWTLPSFLTALALFFIFANIRLKPNRVINFVGGHAFAIYIMHQMPFFYGYLWNGIFHCGNYAGSSFEIPYMLFVTACVFAAASVIDYIFDRVLFEHLFRLFSEPFERVNRAFG